MAILFGNYLFIDTFNLVSEVAFIIHGGLPLLCRRDPCLDEVLVEGSNGYEYEAESEFCSILDTILQNPEWCKAAGAHSKEIAAMYDKGHFADQIEDVYEKVTSE